MIVVIDTKGKTLSVRECYCPTIEELETLDDLSFRAIDTVFDMVQKREYSGGIKTRNDGEFNEKWDKFINYLNLK